LEKTLLFAFIPFFMFPHIGKTYIEEIIPSSSFFYTIQSGLYASFIVSPFFVLLLTAIISFPIFYMRYKGTSLPLSLKFLLVFIMFGFVSSAQTMFYPSYSLYHPLILFGMIIWSIELWMYLQHATKEAYRDIIKTIYIQIVILLGIQIALTFMQMIHGSTLGLFIEYPSNAIISESPDASNLFVHFRPIGLNSHANLMAFQLIDMFACFFSLHILFFQRVRKYAIVLGFITFGFVGSIILSQSRAGYVALASLVMAIGIVYSKYIQRNWLSIKHALPIIKITTLVIIVILSVSIIVLPRILATVDSLFETGGYPFRAEFNKEAVDVISQNALFGVGPGMFIPANLDLHPLGVNYTFPFEVHNNMMLIMAEFGIPAFICYVFGFVSLLFSIRKNRKELLFLFCAILSLFIIASFHALERFFPLSLLVFVLIETYEKKYIRE
jgi:hypothetical protein